MRNFHCARNPLRTRESGETDGAKHEDTHHAAAESWFDALLRSSELYGRCPIRRKLYL